MARTSSAIQGLVGPALGLDPAHPRRVLPARRHRSRGGDSFSGDSVLVGRRDRGAHRRRPPARRRRLSHDRRHPSRARSAEARPAAFRSVPTGMSCTGRGALRHRRTGGGGGVVPPRRLPARWKVTAWVNSIRRSRSGRRREGAALVVRGTCCRSFNAFDLIAGEIVQLIYDLIDRNLSGEELSADCEAISPRLRSLHLGR